jgi:hypothetical protein
MNTGLEYDGSVRHSTLASIARCRRFPLPLNFLSFSFSSGFEFKSVALFFASLVFASTSVLASLAQSGGAASAGSGGGSHAGGGGSASVSFSGSHVAGGVGFGFSGSQGSGAGGSGSNGSASNHGTSHSNPGGNSNHNHPHHPYPSQGGGYGGPVLFAVPFPYVDDPSADYDDADADASTDDSDADYQGGPTIFDRRGTGADSYIPPVEDNSPPTDAAMRADADETPQQPTVLVFKDGHQIEVGNYAIVGVTLFDLTPGHARRVALADLDLEATQKQNEDRGVVFALPASIQAN